MTDTSKLTKQFYNLKNEIITPGSTKIDSIIALKHEAECSTKKNHVLRFLDDLADFYAEPGYGEAVADVKFLPFDTLAEIYAEYRAKTKRLDSAEFPAEILMAGKEVFRKAYNSVKNKLRLRSSKGAFETCSVCNAFHEILKSESSQWSIDKVDLIEKFKRLHLKLQAEEREDSERRKNLARDSFDSSGNILMRLQILLVLMLVYVS